MTENTVDLKQLMYMIYENKDIEINFAMDAGCMFEAADKKPLIKVLNYVLNYTNELTKSPLEVGLDLMGDKCVLNVMAITTEANIPDMNNQLADALKPYGATIERVVDPGKFVQVKMTFKVDAA
ncbi:MAG: hypothetical protein KDD94_13280 [Calditrichaeota bacterium]|nr:hypothetical protein [Calditrichota bacterium]